MNPETASTPMKIVVENLSKNFGDTSALKETSLYAGSNEFVSIVGASGCGKSTLLHLLAGLETPTSGKILVNGTKVTGPGRDRGMVFQRATLLPWLNIQKNVEFALKGEKQLSRSEKTARAKEFLTLAGLEGFENAYPRQLSGGMQQRAALARSLCYNPDILLMDEPFGALDALTRRAMQQLLLEVWEKHRLTVILVTHDIAEAILTSDRVLVMTPRPGRVQKEFTVPLPRPRNLEQMDSPEFRQLHSEILALITQDGSTR